jgi:hypothetical protein
MDPRDRLTPLSGSWQGLSTLHNPETNMPEESPSTLQWTPILSGRFFRVEYTWQYQGTPQEGLFIIGYDPDPHEVTLHWVDTWHMGDSVMACRGKADESGGINVLGSFSVPGSPDWGWRIALQPGPQDSLRLVMHNITPDGQEYPAVEAVYSRE